MNTETLRSLSVAVSMLAAVALAGCGGGGSSSVRDTTGAESPIDSDNDGIIDNADAVEIDRIAFPLRNYSGKLSTARPARAI